MNAMLPLCSLRWLMLFIFSLGCLPLFAVSAFASPDPATATMPFLQANIIWEFASDRGHMIQISFVIVALGCALIWWYR